MPLEASQAQADRHLQRAGQSECRRLLEWAATALEPPSRWRWRLPKASRRTPTQMLRELRGPGELQKSSGLHGATAVETRERKRRRIRPEATCLPSAPQSTFCNFALRNDHGAEQQRENGLLGRRRHTVILGAVPVLCKPARCLANLILFCACMRGEHTLATRATGAC